MTHSGRTARGVARGVVVIVAVTACAPLLGRGARGGGAGLADKPVAQKEPPASLLAADGTGCLVSEEKFGNTGPGERVWCFWSYDGTQTVANARSPASASPVRPRNGSKGPGEPAAARTPARTPASTPARTPARTPKPPTQR